MWARCFESLLSESIALSSSKLIVFDSVDSKERNGFPSCCGLLLSWTGPSTVKARVWTRFNPTSDLTCDLCFRPAGRLHIFHRHSLLASRSHDRKSHRVPSRFTLLKVPMKRNFHFKWAAGLTGLKHQWRQQQRQHHKLRTWLVEQGEIRVLFVRHAL